MKSSIRKLGEKAKSIDIFAEGLYLRVGRDQQTYKTFLGSLLTVIVTIITATYGLRRYNVMSEFGDTVH